MQIQLRELSLSSLDALRVDALALFVDERERPLQGLAGLCDWRLCGRLSEVLERGFFRGEGGETLLMPVGHRLGVGRLLVFGLGERGPAGQAGVQSLCQKSFEAAARAGVRSLALSIDWLGESAETAAEAWARAARRVALDRYVLIGDIRSLSKGVRAAAVGDNTFEIEGDITEVSTSSQRAHR